MAQPFLSSFSLPLRQSSASHACGHPLSDFIRALASAQRYQLRPTMIRNTAAISHRLSFYYFPISGDDAGRLVTWLKMKERDSIPRILPDSIRSASASTLWKFKWDAAKIYVSFYCHPFDGTNSSMDMLLVNDEEAVFFAEGYLAQGWHVTDDPSSCEKPQKQ
jgi:hypothetical protein